MATTDLHGHLLPHDYIKDQPTQGGGLAGLASLIADARAEAAAAQSGTLLLDNGDTFQGTPLATHLAKHPVTPDHPIISSLNYLEYDALGVGNHDLDHGLPYLQAVAGHLKMPLLSSNLTGITLGAIRHSALLPIALPAGVPAPLTIGILSILPEQTAVWHGHHLGATTGQEDPAKAVTTTAAQLRAAGADLVIVLAHMGVGSPEDGPRQDRAGLALTASGPIDALILGHTHRRLPSADFARRAGVDLNQSTVAGVPTVMAGHNGSDLAVMDLNLEYRDGDGWKITGHHCALRRNGPGTPQDPNILARVSETHRSVTSQLATPVAETTERLHSYFSLVAPAPTQRLAARTLHRLVRDALQGTAHADVPVLAAVAAYSTGGREGPGNYINIPQGAVMQRHIAGLTPYADQTLGIHVTGAELMAWLEHAAVLFNTLEAEQNDQPLINSDIPGFQFDTIFGVNYVIDPSGQPYQRIKSLTWQDQPVREDHVFILATNQFRVAGGGGYRPSPPDRVIVRATAPLEPAMIATLTRSDPDPWPAAAPWRFASLGGIQALINSEPGAAECLDDIAHLDPQPQGTTAEGFTSLRITL